MDGEATVFWFLFKDECNQVTRVGVKISVGCNEDLRQERSLCVALAIEEPDFSVEFDRSKKAWIDNQAPTSLRNKIAKYSVSQLVHKKCHPELEILVDNGRLISYLQEEHEPHGGRVPLMVMVQENKKKVAL